MFDISFLLQDPSEQHFIGFMYLEGIDCEKNYTKAYQYFDNSTNPFYNTTFHVFGRGIMHFYGLGVKENKTLGCEYITQASSNSIGNSVITYFFFEFYLVQILSWIMCFT